MKRFVSVLLAFLFCCFFLAAPAALADVSHVKENLRASSDYLVFSPEYSTKRGTWELWVMAYRIECGCPDYEQDKCVSASLLSMKNLASSAGTLSALLGMNYTLEDMMDLEYVGVRYYMFNDFEYAKPCYLANPGGEHTELSPIQSIELMETREDQTISLWSEGSNPSFMTLCQLWLYASRFNQIPSQVTKTFGMDPAKNQTLYSKKVSDYCSNQEKLQSYCNTLIPVVDSVSSSDKDKPHFGTDIYYKKGPVLFCVSPFKKGLSVRFNMKAK